MSRVNQLNAWHLLPLGLFDTDSLRNAMAGASDAMSMGLGKGLRHSAIEKGWVPDSVDECSNAYGFGQKAAVVYGLARAAAGFIANGIKKSIGAVKKGVENAGQGFKNLNVGKPYWQRNTGAINPTGTSAAKKLAEITTDRVGRIASDLNKTTRQVRDAIHSVKRSANLEGNPDVVVDTITGNVYPRFRVEVLAIWSVTYSIIFIKTY